jgi:hypothetical protein
MAIAVQTAPAPRPVLWHDPGAIGSLDLSWSDQTRFTPPVPPFAFLKEDTSGSRAKVRVKDAKGVEWNVKLAGDADDTAEVHAEVAAQRIVWALGYFIEPGYFVDGGTIAGVKDLHRASRGLTNDGRFRAARFKEPPHSESTGDHWTFKDNPFIGTRELSGLMILMTMINNWDLSANNLGVLRHTREDGTRERRYVVSDLGGSFGHMENVRLPYSIFSTYPWTKWNLHDYQRQTFIDSVHDGRIRLHYRGEVTMPEIPIDHARWFLGLVSQLTPIQLRQAFEAAGATPDQVAGFSARFSEKVEDLRTAVSESRDHAGRSEPGASTARRNSPASSHTRAQASHVSMMMLPGA